MKRFLPLILFLAITSLSFAQSNHVLKLKDGTTIKGVILELLPSESVKIQTTDGITKEFDIAQIEDLRLAYEPLKQDKYPIDESGDRRYIMRESDHFLWYKSGKELTNKDLRQIFSLDMYKTYQSARKQLNTGNALLAIGLVSAISGVSFYIIDKASNNEDKGNEISAISLGMLSGSELFLGLGFLFRGIGKGRLNWVQDTYNATDYTSHNALSISPSLLLTSQNDISFGATLSFSF